MSKGLGSYSPSTKCRVNHFDNDIRRVLDNGNGSLFKRDIVGASEHYGSHGSGSHCFPCACCSY